MCKTRMAWDGRSEDRSLGWVTVVRDDPIEKKYIFHVNPGSLVRTIGFSGCSLQCSFCQNEDLSHNYKLPSIPLHDLSLSGLDLSGVAFSYSEPTLHWENMAYIGERALGKGLYTVVNTNGFLTQETRDKLAWVNIWSIGIKGSRAHYDALKIPGAEFCYETASWALNNVQHVEVSIVLFPVVPIEKVWEDLDEYGLWDVPLHFQKGYARGSYDGPVYTGEEMTEIWLEARKVSPYVYLHNVLVDGVRDTICPECQDVIVQRPLLRAESVRPCSCNIAKFKEEARALKVSTPL